MKLSRVAITLLLLVTSTTAWAQNKFVLAYTPDPNFVNQYNIPGQEFSNYGYRTYQETRGEAITVMGCPIWTGHTFTHWFAYWTKQDGTFAYCDFHKDDVIPAAITNEISTDNPVLTLQAVFVKNDYTLTFDANGGTGAEMADMPMTYTDSYTLPACTYSKSGAVFMGWTTNADGTGNFFCDGDRVSNMTTEQHGNVTLYAQYLETTGTADDPYLIGNAPTWNILAGRVNKGIDSYKYYKMTANIETGRMMGTTAHPFCGHFDGNGHSLRGYFSLNLNEIENDTYAPFKYVKNATFINLRITSDIYVDGYKPCGVSAGGCVGAVMPQGNVNFVACHSSARGSFAWSSNNNGDMRGGSFGGFISFLSATSSATFLDCLSSAEAYWYPYQVGYFIGVAEGGSNATFTNCFESTEKFPFQYYNGEVTKRIYVPQYPFVALPQFVNETYNNCWRRMCDDCDMLENEPPGTYAHQGTYTDSKKSTTLNSLGNGWVRDRYGDVFPRIPANTNSITISSDIVHGTVASLETAVPGQDVMLSVTPEEGYHITSVTYNDGSDHDATLRDGKYWFTMPGSNVTVSATFAVDDDAVQYVAYNTESRMYETKYFKRSSVTNVTSSSTNLGTSGQEKKYVVTDDVTVSDRIYVNGTVHLVLADGATLTAEKGVNVHSGNSLIVYGQEGGTGTLNARGCQIMGGDNWESAAIGSDGNGNGNINAYLGDLTFHSGVVNATGYYNAAGIGGGRYNPESGSITIYGGTISAKAINTFNSNPIAQAIGCGASGTIVSKSIADGLRVYTNNSTTPTLVEYAYRQQNGLSQTDVRVERCTEHNYQDGRCTYCGAYQYHQITYNGNGNTSGTAPEVATCNVTMGIHTATGTVADAGTLERTGYSFTGWNTEADGSGTAYAPDETITLTSSITLYAQWSLITYTITYDLAGGTEPLIPNPTSFSILSEDIILNNPTRIDYDADNNPIYYYFRGWGGTGIDNPVLNVTIPQGSTGDRTYTATWEMNPSPYPGVNVDKDFEPDEAGYFYVKMARDWHYEYNEAGDEYEVEAEDNPKTVNIPEEFSSGFKVYDDGGKDGVYNDYQNGNTLTLNCQEGYAFYVQGTMETQSDCDKLTIYDGGDDQCAKLLDEASGRRNIGPLVSSGNSITFYFDHDGSNCNAQKPGFDLTVKLVPPPSAISLASDDSQSAETNTSVIASNDGERAKVTIDGYSLFKDETWNTLCLPFDISDISSSILRGAVVKQPSSIELSQSGTLSMNFRDVNSIEAGKPYIVKWLDVSPQYTVLNNEETGLFDGEVGIWENEWQHLYGFEPVWEFEISGTMAVTGYTLTTSCELVDDWPRITYYPQYNPTAWTLEASTDRETWTIIDSRDVEQNPEDALPVANNEVKSYSVSVAQQGTYRYFRFSIIDKGQSYHLGEFTLQGTFTPDNIEDPTFNSVTIKNELNPMTTGVLSFGGRYSSLASTDGLLLDAHNAEANAFRATLSLPDRPWYTDAGHTTTATTIPFDPVTGNVTLYTLADDLLLTLANDDSSEPVSNNDLIVAKEGEFSIVTLTNRTLYMDGSWNTLCLPFDLGSFSGTPLEGATVKAVTSMAYNNENSSLTMTFSDNLTSMEAGKPYIVKWDEIDFPIINVSNDLLTRLNFITEIPSVDVGLDTNWDHENENYDKLVDGNLGTKYGMEYNGSDYNPYVEFHYANAITPTGYALWTANDQEGWRNPSSWTIQAKNEGDEVWTTLVTVDNSSGNMLPMANNTCSLFDLNNSTAYKYFRFEAEYASNDEFQLAELQFFSRNANATIENPVFSGVIVESASNPVADENFIFAGNYNTLASTNGLLLDAHNVGGKALHTTLGSNRDGYKVSGWYTDAEKTTPVTTIPFDATTGNVTLYATWGLADYAIAYDLNGGSLATPNPITYTAETAAFTLTNPTRENYVFIGWSGTDIDNVSYTVTVEQGSTGNRNYTATWTPVPYGITYNGMEGATFESVAPTTYTIESGEITLSTPMRSGYTFGGWYTNAELTGDPVTTIAAGSTGDKEFWAKWTATEYYIVYATNGGTMPDNYTDSYTIESAAVTLPTPTRGGYTFAGWYDNAELTGDAVTTIATGSAGLKTFHAKWTENVLELANATDNNEAIQAASGKTYSVTLVGRTFWKDDDWNTLCLPFNLTLSGSPLDGDGVEVRTLSSAGFNDGTLTLNFTPATGEGAVTELVAGTPYIIKWNNTDTHLTQTDLVFHGVIIDATMRNQVCEFGDGKSISFVGTYSPVVYNDENKSVLFLGGGNSLYYPDGEYPTTINACRAYFMLNGITAGDPASGGDVKAFKLNFGDQTVTSIQNSEFRIHHEDGGWYTVDGRKLEKKPTQRGIYIHNGTKVAIK